MTDILLVKRVRFYQPQEPALRGKAGREYRFFRQRGREPLCLVDEEDAETFLKLRRPYLGSMVSVFRLATEEETEAWLR